VKRTLYSKAPVLTHNMLEHRKSELHIVMFWMRKMRCMSYVDTVNSQGYVWLILVGQDPRA
jgi:hypothetical protein